MPSALVIDDSRVIRKVARSLLEEMGFEVREAEDGALALEALRERTADVAIVDAAMPNMDGVAFLKALRREPSIAPRAAIFCTTENDAAHLDQAYLAGARGVLLKPFDKGTMEAALAASGALTA